MVIKKAIAKIARGPPYASMVIEEHDARNVMALRYASTINICDHARIAMTSIV